MPGRKLVHLQARFVLDWLDCFSEDQLLLRVLELEGVVRLLKLNFIVVDDLFVGH